MKKSFGCIAVIVIFLIVSIVVGGVQHAAFGDKGVPPMIWAFIAIIIIGVFIAVMRN